MHTLIVLAQPEPRSFNGRLTKLAAEQLRARGGTVEITDLYRQGFNPVEGPAHYASRMDPEYFETQGEQRHAYRTGTVPADVEAELAKVRRADFLLFQFPVWWWGPPAMLKGWLDRCWIYGGMYTSRTRFEKGPMSGKRAMLSCTLGASAEAGGSDGNEGDTMLALWPMLISLRYVGLSVLPPLLIYGVHGGLNGAQSEALAETQRKAEAALADRLQRLDETPELPFNTAEHFGDDHRLKPDAPVYSPYVRHRRELDIGGGQPTAGYPATVAGKGGTA